MRALVEKMKMGASGVRANFLRKRHTMDSLNFWANPQSWCWWGEKNEVVAVD
jgi:hypothetical protein